MRYCLIITALTLAGCQQSSDPNARELVPDPEAAAKDAAAPVEPNSDGGSTVGSLEANAADNEALTASDNEQFEATIIEVTSGDTCTALTDDKRQIKIRLHGIDSPEPGQPYGADAKEVLSGLADRRVLVVNHGDDEQDTIAADLYLLDDDSTGVVESVSLQMVHAGWSWHLPSSSKDSRLATAMKQARAAKRGLWAQEDDRDPVAPWEWRKLSEEQRDELR